MNSLRYYDRDNTVSISYVEMENDKLRLKVEKQDLFLFLIVVGCCDYSNWRKEKECPETGWYIK